ncbi:hypothetical protein CR970_00605 [Candidatus Saccharibacteria bacterium]|nr:MAG: hypothetical protein CR970_00605 [Candidatus Saccharibacteria bacterium]
MSKLDDIVAKYQEENTKLGLGIKADLLEAVTRALGPSVYDADASRVSGNDPDELATVKQNYLIKKLGLADSPDLDKAIETVMARFDSSSPNKYRALVYALLCEHFDKQSVYDL